jgi:hypothetical protein
MRCSTQARTSKATGAIFTGGAPLSDAVVFANWNAARRLVEHGARPTWWQAAALGMIDLVRARWQTAADTRRDHAGVLACVPCRAAEHRGVSRRARHQP